MSLKRWESHRVSMDEVCGSVDGINDPRWVVGDVANIVSLVLSNILLTYELVTRELGRQPANQQLLGGLFSQG